MPGILIGLMLGLVEKVLTQDFVDTFACHLFYAVAKKSGSPLALQLVGDAAKALGVKVDG